MSHRRTFADTSLSRSRDCPTLILRPGYISPQSTTSSTQWKHSIKTFLTHNRQNRLTITEKLLFSFESGLNYLLVSFAGYFDLTIPSLSSITFMKEQKKVNEKTIARTGCDGLWSLPRRDRVVPRRRTSTTRSTASRLLCRRMLQWHFYRRRMTTITTTTMKAFIANYSAPRRQRFNAWPALVASVQARRHEPIFLRTSPAVLGRRLSRREDGTTGAWQGEDRSPPARHRLPLSLSLSLRRQSVSSATQLTDELIQFGVRPSGVVSRFTTHVAVDNGAQWTPPFSI